MDSYETFYRENKARVFGYLLHLTGDYHRSVDFMQESFTRYFARYRCNGNNCALLYTIARNFALDALRKRREEKLENKDALSVGRDPECQLIEKQGVDRMMTAIQQLSSADRELIALLTAKTFSYRQIGKLLDISEGSVKVRVHRARMRLRAILANGGQ